MEKIILLFAITTVVSACTIPEIVVTIEKGKSASAKVVFYSERTSPNTAHLKLQNQSIPVLNKNFFTSATLEKIQINSCNLTQIEEYTFYHLKQLATLNLSKNKLKTITNGIFDNPELDCLDISHNHITSIAPNAFSKLPKLKTVNLGYNQLTSVDAYWFKTNQQLNTLGIHNNRIVTIPEGFLTQQTKRVFVNAVYNPIETVEDGAFQNMNELTLNLLHTSLRNISSMFKDVGQVKHLIIGSKRTQCYSKEELENLEIVKTLHIYKSDLPSACFSFVKTWGLSNKVTVTDDYYKQWEYVRIY